MAFDELMSTGINDYYSAGRKLPLGRRNYSALYIGPTALTNSFEIDQAALRRAKSAESILCSPRIVVNRYYVDVVVLDVVVLDVVVLDCDGFLIPGTKHLSE